MKKGFWDLFAESVIIQGVLTLAVVGTICYLVILGKPIPEIMVNLSGLIVGFWFGTKVTKSTSSMLRRE